MSYNPTVWSDGDLVTSAKLNKIEQGIANGGSSVITIGQDGALDKTWQEIWDGNYIVVIIEQDNIRYYGFIDEIGAGKSNYYITASASGLGIMNFYASIPDDYPTIQETVTEEETPTES